MSIFRINLEDIATVDKLRSQLIDKILAIKNKAFLEALDKLLATSTTSSDAIELSVEQKEMLEMSESDIEKGHLISEEAMDKRNIEWLGER